MYKRILKQKPDVQDSTNKFKQQFKIKKRGITPSYQGNYEQEIKEIGINLIPSHAF